MGKKGNISLEGYRKNSPDRFNDFNIIPSNEISMQNVNKNVLMIPMGGRGTGNPILAKPGERYFFPNHDFVFEQAMPENAIMRYQRIMRNGGPLPKAQMYNSQVGVPLNTNDFIYTPQELEKYKNIYDQRIANCKKGDAACLEQANNYYNMYVAPKLNAPSTWDIAEKMGITTGPNNPRVKEYGTAADSWDLPGLYKQSGAKVNLAAPIKNPSEIQNKLASMSDEDLKKYWINMNLPLGALVNFGQAGLDEHYGKGQAYNISQGLVPSNHSARVSGYSPEGVPYIYDYGRITPITDPTFKSMPLTTITSPKEIQGYTFENLKKQGKLEGSKMNPLKISTKDADYDPDEYEPFIASLQKNKDLYANALNMSDEEYNNYAKHAAALALTETKGGDDLSIRWWHGFLPTLSYVTDKLGLGDTKGITQINPNVLFNKKSLADKLESLGIRKDNYDPWNPDHAAIATMALLKDNRAVQDKHAKTAGNKADLSEAEKTYYQWSMPRTLRIGDAKGESAKIKKYLENYNKIQADFDPHNRYLAENRKFGGDLHKAQDGEEFSGYQRPGPVASENPNDYFGYVARETATKKSLPTKKSVTKKSDTKTPEGWEKEIRDLEKILGDPSTWTLESYKILQEMLNEYKAWRENTPEGRAVVDYHNEPGEYEVPLPSHLKNKNQQPILPAVTTYASGKEQNSVYHTNPQEWLRQNYLANKAAKQTQRLGDFITKSGSYIPGALGLPFTTASIFKNLEDKDYPGTFYELLSSAGGKAGLIGKGLNLYNDLTEKAYGGDLPKAQMYNSQVNRPMPNFDPRVMGPAMRQQQIAAHNRAVAEMSTPDVLQEYTPQKFSAKALDVATNPFTAATNMYQHGYLPDNFTQGQRNYLDYAQDYVNPASLGRSIYNAATNVFDPEMYKDIARSGFSGILGLAGEEIPQSYMDANMRNLQRLGDFASAVPGIKSASPYVKKAIETTQKQLSKGAKVAAKVADKKIIKPLQELTQTTKPIQNFSQLNNVKTSNTFNDLTSFSKYFQNKFGTEDNLLRSLQEKGFDTRIIDHVFNQGTVEERIKLANHLYDVLQGSKIDRALVKADEFIGKTLVKGAQAPELKQVVEKANEKLAKGLGVKKGELPIQLRANEANNTVSVKVGDKFTGFVELSPVSQPSPRFSEILKGKKPTFVKDYADALNFKNAQFPGLAKSSDFPFTGASEDFGKQLMGQGYSGEINKAISEALKERGARLYSGATGHTDFGRQRYQNLLSKGLVEDISPKIPGSHNLVIPGNEIYMYKKKGGALPNRRETNKNIKSSINNLMRRNETLFGPAGKNFYNPNPMSKYYKGGIAFPQAPTAGDTPGQQESEFYSPNWIPPGPVGFYEHGGIAYPQQPTNDYFFSGSPWMPHYDMGGGLPGGANNMYMPCMNCGGYMKDGGMYYADMGINMTSNYGTDPMTDKKMTPQEWSAYNKKMGYTEIPGSSTYKKYYNAQEYTPDENFTFTKVGDVGKNVDYSNDPTYKPLIEYGYKEEQKPIQTKQSRVIPELSNRREIDNNQYFKTYRGPDNKLSYYDMQSNQPIDPTKSFEGGKYKASFLNSPVIAKQRYGGFQEGGFMSPDNMMDYPIFSQGGDPYGYADGGINNPGFRALPENVQQKIISNMQDGGNVLGLDQDQIIRTLGQNFMSGVQGNMSPNLMREAVTQYVQNPFDMPQGEYGYNMNTPNMMNANNMYAAQQRMNELANKNSRIGSDIYNTGMFALGTANPYTKYKAKKAGKGTLPGTPDMTANPDIASNKGLNNVTTQSVQPDMTGADMAQTGMARYGAAYIPKADVGKFIPKSFREPINFPSNFGKLPFASASTATDVDANTSNLSPELLAILKAHNDDNAAYAQKYAMIDQMEKAGYPYMMGAYPNMMGQQGQFAPNFQGMYDMFGNDDYRVGRMSRGMQNMLPYMMFNPQNTYLQEFNAKKALFGPGARKVSMKFRTVFDPRTGQQVQVPVETKEVAKDSKSKMTNQEGRSAQKDYEDMNLFERMRSNRQAKRMMREDERRFKGAKGSSNDEEDFIKQAMEEEARREKKWGVQKAIPNDTKQTFTQMSNLSTGPVDQNKLITESIAKSMAEREALRDPLAHSDEIEESPYDFQKRVSAGNMFGDYRPQYDYNFGPAGVNSLDQDWNAISRTKPGFQQDAMINQYMQNQSRMATAPSYSPNSARGFSQDFYGLPTGYMTPDLPSSNRTAYSLDSQGKPVRNTMQSLMQSQLQPQRYGGMYEEGGIHELTEDEINQILAAGGSVTYID